MMQGLFISYKDFLKPGGGGVQICTREYIEIVEATGIGLRIVPFEYDRRPLTRLVRRFYASSYFRPADAGLVGYIAEIVSETAPDLIFLNQVSLAPLAIELKKCLGNAVKIVLLSHGLESTDLLHLIRLRKSLPIRSRLLPSPAMLLGRSLLEEMQSRPWIDTVCVLSPFDAELEEWLGASRTCFLPRRVAECPVDWKPDWGRFGWVGTLDHPPNLEGLIQILDVLAFRSDQAVRIRVAGGPRHIGEWLSLTYPFVDYLGPLSDGALAREVSTWTAFLNPIFCRARGCSTKLATALSWRIPIVTTPIGRRGYTWREGSLCEASSPENFVSECLGLLGPGQAEAARKQSIKAAETAPTTDEIASILRQELEAMLPKADGRQREANSGRVTPSTVRAALLQGWR